jgi:hypothetical protein
VSWLLIVLVAAGLVALARIYVKVRAVRKLAQDDWDSRTIDRLRKAGSDPFKPHDVDFFFALPSEEATRAVNAQLEVEGFAVDIKAVPDTTELPYSLHARKSMRLSVPDMRELSRRFGALAEAQGGRYDGWAADVVKGAAG